MLDYLHHRHSPFLDAVLTRSGMVSCCLFILLITAAFNQLCLAREGIREPTVVFEIDRILTHAVFADMYSFSPQSISLVACCARTSSALSDKGPRDVTRYVWLEQRQETDLGLIPPLELITRCQGTLPL